jgi:hypothetical protein
VRVPFVANLACTGITVDDALGGGARNGINRNQCAGLLPQRIAPGLVAVPEQRPFAAQAQV